MTTTTSTLTPSSTSLARAPVAFWAAASLGLAWNLFGLVQLVDALQSTRESLEAMGMTPAQAEALGTYPAWMTAGFVVGVLGGVVGCGLLLARRRLATPVFTASLVGYGVLYVGDITEGVFAALGAPQVIVLSTVVAIAAGLLALARWSARRGLLA